jgi:hypothetical protein
MQQYNTPQPANPPQERAPEPPQPRPQQDAYSSPREYDSDNIEIPTFLRKRR